MKSKLSSIFINVLFLTVLLFQHCSAYNINNVGSFFRCTELLGNDQTIEVQLSTSPRLLRGYLEVKIRNWSGSQVHIHLQLNDTTPVPNILYLFASSPGNTTGKYLSGFGLDASSSFGFRYDKAFWGLEFTRVNTSVLFFDHVTVEEVSNNGTVINSLYITDKDLVKYCYWNKQLIRERIYSLVATSINTCLSIVNITVLLALVNQKIIKYRTISVFPCAIALMIFDLVGVCSEIALLKFARVDKIHAFKGPIFSAVGGIKLWVVMFSSICYTLNIIRYFYMRNMYKVMSNFTKLSDPTSKSIVIYKKLGGKLVFALLLLVGAVISVGIVVAFAYKLGPVWGNLIIALFAGITAISSLVACIVDLVLNWSSVRVYGLMQYFRGDPLLARVEVYMVFPSLVVGIAYVLLISGVGKPTFDVVQLDTRLNAYSLWTSILLVLFGICIRLYLAGGLVCIIRIVSKFFYIRESTPTGNDSELESILKDHEVYKMMFDYCQEEFSLENLLAWKHMEKLRQNSATLILEEVIELSNTYVVANSPLQINMPHKSVQKFAAIVEEAQRTNEAVAFGAVADILMPPVVENLNDTFTRLVRTPRYRSHQNSKRALEKQFGSIN